MSEVKNSYTEPSRIIPEGWVETTLGEIALIIMGQSPSGETCNQNDEGLPLLNGPTEFGEIHPFPIQYTIDPRKTSKINDLLFCVRGSTTGRMNWSNQVYAIGRGIATIRHKKGEDYRKFIKGIFDYNLQKLLAEATGSTFPNVSKNQLENIEILLPPLPEQKSIASILTSFDNKIELLQAQNKTLEELAQTLFKEWFGKYKVGDELPDGWRVGVIEDLTVRMNSGGTPSTKEESYYNGNINWFSTKELQDNFIFESDKKITEKGLNNSSTKLFPKDTIIMAIYAAPTVGRLGILNQESAFNQAAVGLVAKNEIGYPFVFLLLKYFRDDFNNLSNGAAQQNLNVGLVKNYKISIPNEETFKHFNDKLTPVFEKIRANSIQIQTLTKTRDELLPKLMSGEIRVKM